MFLFIQRISYNVYNNNFKLIEPLVGVLLCNTYYRQFWVDNGWSCQCFILCFPPLFSLELQNLQTGGKVVNKRMNKVIEDVYRNCDQPVSLYDSNRETILIVRCMTRNRAYINSNLVMIFVLIN